MFHKKILITLFLAVHLTLSLKSSDFCILTQQKECKGYYDKHETYRIKCRQMKCHGKFNHDCGLNICSNNNIECENHNQFELYMNLIFYVKECQEKKYEFNSNDFCLNNNLIQQNCNNLHDHHSKQSFICGKYCTIDSMACDFYKSNENKKYFTNINNCLYKTLRVV